MYVMLVAVLGKWMPSALQINRKARHPDAMMDRLHVRISAMVELAGVYNDR